MGSERSLYRGISRSGKIELFLNYSDGCRMLFVLVDKARGMPSRIMDDVYRHTMPG